VVNFLSKSVLAQSGKKPLEIFGVENQYKPTFIKYDRDESIYRGTV
jgi:hypothetical protein